MIEPMEQLCIYFITQECEDEDNLIMKCPLYCDHYGRVGLGTVPMIRKSWGRILAESVIVVALGKSISTAPSYQRSNKNGTMRAVRTLSADQFCVLMSSIGCMLPGELRWNQE